MHQTNPITGLKTTVYPLLVSSFPPVNNLLTALYASLGIWSEYPELCISFLEWFCNDVQLFQTRSSDALTTCLDNTVLYLPPKLSACIKVAEYERTFQCHCGSYLFTSLYILCRKYFRSSKLDLNHTFSWENKARLVEEVTKCLGCSLLASSFSLGKMFTVTKLILWTLQ